MDASIYDALVRMAQDFSMRYPLIDGHGNFGSIDGDIAAAYRYSESRLTKISLLGLDYLKYNAVDMQQGSSKHDEPIVLPMLYPNLLVNGTFGIAVGMATNIPPHNLSNSIDAVVLKLDNKNSSTKDLLTQLKGPDFPTGGIITNKKDLLSLYETGKGEVIIRGKYSIENNKNTNSIVITEIPYTISGKKENFVESIIKLGKDKKELQIVEVRDESSKEGIRVVIDIKKDADINTVVNYLYKFTAFEDSLKSQFLCLVDGMPKTISLEEYISYFIKFQKEIYAKKYKYKINKNKLEIEKLEGFIKAYEDIDTIIEIAKKSESRAEMKQILLSGEVPVKRGFSVNIKKCAKTFNFTEYQADILCDTMLHQLSNTKILNYKNEVKNLITETQSFEKIISSDKLLSNEIKKALLDIKKQYGDSRRTLIQNVETDFVPIREKYTCVIDENNYVKIIRGSNDSGFDIEIEDKICAISSDGTVSFVKVSAIPTCTLKDKGTAIENYISSKEPVLAIFKPCEKSEILYISDDGYAKRVSGEEYIVSRNSLKGNNQKYLNVVFIINHTTVTVNNEKGKTKKIAIKDIPILSRTAKGNKLIQGKFNIIDCKVD